MEGPGALRGAFVTPADPGAWPRSRAEGTEATGPQGHRATVLGRRQAINGAGVAVASRVPATLGQASHPSRIGSATSVPDNRDQGSVFPPGPDPGTPPQTPDAFERERERESNALEQHHTIAQRSTSQHIAAQGGATKSPSLFCTKLASARRHPTRPSRDWAVTITTTRWQCCLLCAKHTKPGFPSPSPQPREHRESPGHIKNKRDARQATLCSIPPPDN